MPGNAQQQAVLGYFHANCGHCHNSQSPLINRPMFRLEDRPLRVADRDANLPIDGQRAGLTYGGATIIAKPGDPDHSIIYTRMHSTRPEEEDARPGQRDTRHGGHHDDSELDHKPLAARRYLTGSPGPTKQPSLGSRANSSAEERRPYKAVVAGSNPASPTENLNSGAVVKSVITPACHAGGRGFESRPLRDLTQRS